MKSNIGSIYFQITFLNMRSEMIVVHRNILESNFPQSTFLYKSLVPNYLDD